MAKANKGQVEKSSAKTVRTRRGPAEVLDGPAFKAWLVHLQNQGPTWLWVVTSLCHLLCARVSEILNLQKVDLNLRDGWVRIQGLKNHGEIFKPLSAAAKSLLESWEDQGGQSWPRTRRWGNLGLRTYHDRWSMPVSDTDYLFPAKRKDSLTPQMNKAGFVKKAKPGSGGFRKFRIP